MNSDSFHQNFIKISVFQILHLNLKSTIHTSGIILSKRNQKTLLGKSLENHSEVKAAEGKCLILLEEIQGTLNSFSLNTVFYYSVEQFESFLKPPIADNKTSLIEISHIALVYYMNLRVLRPIYISNMILRNCIRTTLAVKIYNNNSSSCFLLIFYVQKNLRIQKNTQTFENIEVDYCSQQN